MILRKITSEGLAHKSYFLSGGGEAAVIDPRRDIGAYLDLAMETGSLVRYIFETHRNEDYLVGSLDLADRTGAEILHGRKMDFAYGRKVHEGHTFPGATRCCKKEQAAPQFQTPPKPGPATYPLPYCHGSTIALPLYCSHGERSPWEQYNGSAMVPR